MSPVCSAGARFSHWFAPAPDQVMSPYADRSGTARRSDALIGTGTNCFGSKILMNESARPVVPSVNAASMTTAAAASQRGARQPRAGRSGGREGGGVARNR
jgi:hypothetical protein